MFYRDKFKRLPIKTVYYISFLFLIVIPILIVLIVALLELNHQFKNQAIENIKRAQDAIITNLHSEEEVMSIRLSHMVYSNNNEILKYAAETDTADVNIKNDSEQKLSQAVNLVLEPVKEVISVYFYMKDGKETYIKNNITKVQSEIKATKLYQSALKKSNTVGMGFYETSATNDFYMGSIKDTLILIFALSPDGTTDRSQKVEMVMYYQSSGVSDRIKAYNRDYLAGKNKLGITQITDTDGNVVYYTKKGSDFGSGKYTCIKTPIKFNQNIWYIESYIKTSELTSNFFDTAKLVLVAAVLILVFAGYFAGYFLRRIVKPIEEISNGLRHVEEGDLEVYISAVGQHEVRTMIHQFNAMVRRLRGLVDEYEERIKKADKTPKDLFSSLIKAEITPEELNKKSKEFFSEPYVIIGFHVNNYNISDKAETSSKLMNCFERNPRFVSRCILYKETSELIWVLYRVAENDYSYKIKNMIEELQRAGKQELGVNIFACVGYKKFGHTEFAVQVEEIREKLCIRHLTLSTAIVNLEQDGDKLTKILLQGNQYKKLADALYIADEKNIVQEKDKMFSLFGNLSLDEIKMQVYSVILSIGNCFTKDNSSFSEVFGQESDYFEKISRIDDVRGIKLWLTNYFGWIMDYSASKLNVSETDPVIKAKRYIADNYENADLSLIDVAEYVGLNERYFTNRFTKETGETFSAYLTALRIQKSRDLLKSTSFKVYEIAEMVGYYNVEHFNRTFKKLNGITPVQYRKNS